VVTCADVVSEQFPIEFGRYKLVDRLAVGGMAELFLAEVTGAHGFQKTVVIKRILPNLGSDPEFTAMFIDEAKLTARLAHPKIAQTFELGRHDDQLFIAMEFVDGLDTLAMLRECAHRRIRMPTDIVVHIAHEILDALDFAHNQVDESGVSLGIVHRDISPSNVLVSKRGDIKLVDFGIAQALQSDHQTQAGTLKGKYGYMSPEQILGGVIDARSDLFSVGIVLVEMLMGRRLFAAPTELDVLLMVRDVDLGRLERYGGHIDPGLLGIVRRALQKPPEERFEDAASFREALGEWLFENRHRVTPRRVSEFVSSLYDDAWTRKRTALAQHAAESMSAKGSGATPTPEMPTGSAEALISGIPEGSGAEEFPAQYSAPEIQIDQGAAAGGNGEAPAERSPASESRAGEVEADEPVEGAEDLALYDGGDAAPLAGEAGADPAPADADGPPTELEFDESIAIDLDLDLDFNDSELELALAPASGEAADEATSVALVERGEAAPASVPEAVALDDDLSVRFASIEAAVSSISPAERDPAAHEFDGSDLSASAPTRRPSRPDLRAGDGSTPAVPQAPASLQPIEREPDSRGEFAERSALHVLYRLAVADATGLLVVEMNGIRKDIYIRDGDPEFVSSNVAGELFGSYLVSQKVLTSGELDMALAMMPRYGGKLGDTLVGLGLMKPLDVFRHLSRQVRDKLIDVCTWGKGSYAWYEAYENPRESFPLDIDSFQVLGAGAMAFPEEAILAWAETVAHLAPRSEKNPYVNAEQFRVAHWARSVFDALDGRHTVWELAGRYTQDADRLSFLRALRLLIECELAEGGAQSAASSS
jgi:eukaryotic-like serine/threonine-protein kinase